MSPLGWTPTDVCVWPIGSAVASRFFAIGSLGGDELRGRRLAGGGVQGAPGSLSASLATSRATQSQSCCGYSASSAVDHLTPEPEAWPPQGAWSWLPGQLACSDVMSMLAVFQEVHLGRRPPWAHAWKALSVRVGANSAQQGTLHMWLRRGLSTESATPLEADAFTAAAQAA